MEVWPVIHVDHRDAAQPFRCASMAKRCGADGALMISMDGHDNVALLAASYARQALPPVFKIGINLLAMTPAGSLLESQGLNLDATWTDRQIFTRGEISADARDVMAVVRPGHKFFAAVAFKGQEQDPFPADSAKLAAQHGMIPTTSGSRTGSAPHAMHIAHVGAHLEPGDPLAIASGATPELVLEWRGAITHVLTWSYIAKGAHEFDETKLRRMVAAARGEG